MSPNLEQNPFRSLPYIDVQLPAVVRAAKKDIIGEIKLPSLFHTSSRRLSASASGIGMPGNLSSRSFVMFESGKGVGANSKDNKVQNKGIVGEGGEGEGEKEGEDEDVGDDGTGTIRHRKKVPLSTYALYSSVVAVVERLYFLSPPNGGEWIEDEEQHTDWAGSSYFPSNNGAQNGVPFPGVRPTDSASIFNFNSLNPSRSVSGLAFALASSNAGVDTKSTLDGCYQPYNSNQIINSFSRSALSFSNSPPLSPVGAHSRDPRKTLRPQDIAFSSSLPAVVEDTPSSANKTQKHMTPHTHTQGQETASTQDSNSSYNNNNNDNNNSNDSSYNVDSKGVRGIGTAGAVEKGRERERKGSSHKDQVKGLEGVQGTGAGAGTGTGAGTGARVGMQSYGSPVRNTGAISGLSQSLAHLNQNQNHNMSQSRSRNENNDDHHQAGSLSDNNLELSLNLPIPNDSPRSPLLSPYTKTSTGSNYVPNAPQNKSPSWRARDRDRDRSAVRSTGATGGLSRMQSLGGGPGISHYSGVGPGLGPLPGHTGSNTVSGGMDVKAMIGEAKRRSDQRLNTDHQYLHRMAFACVRVGPTGFVWLSNVSGRVSKLS